MADDTSAKASHGGHAAGHDQTVNYAPSPELVETIGALARRPLEELNEVQRAQIQDLQKKLETSHGILHQVAAILTAQFERGSIPFEKIPELLIDMVKQRQAVADQERARPLDPDAAFAQLQQKIAAALSAGDDDQARQLLEEKRDAKLAAMKKRRETAEHLQDAATRDLLDAAESEAALGELARGRLEYRIAAEHFRAAAELLSADAAHASERLGYSLRVANALYAQGDEFGDNDALIEAVATYRNALEERTRERVPLQWAATQNNLGNALWTLGKRLRKVQPFQEAIRAIDGAYDVNINEAGYVKYEAYFTERLEAIRADLAELEKS